MQKQDVLARWTNVREFQRPHHIIFIPACQCESRKKSAYWKGLYLLKTHDFYYDLPEELIAQTPLERRDASRLMTLDRKTGEVTHRHFYDLLELLQPGDCLVMNNSRVLPARLLGHRVPTGGAVEVLLLKDQGNGIWGVPYEAGPQDAHRDRAVLRRRRSDGDRSRGEGRRQQARAVPL